MKLNSSKCILVWVRANSWIIYIATYTQTHIHVNSILASFSGLWVMAFCSQAGRHHPHKTRSQVWEFDLDHVSLTRSEIYIQLLVIYILSDYSLLLISMMTLCSQTISTCLPFGLAMRHLDRMIPINYKALHPQHHISNKAWGYLAMCPHS